MLPRDLVTTIAVTTIGYLHTEATQRGLGDDLTRILATIAITEAGPT